MGIGMISSVCCKIEPAFLSCVPWARCSENLVFNMLQDISAALDVQDLHAAGASFQRESKHKTAPVHMHACQPQPDRCLSSLLR